jgi:Do/DeqQ family serine protease
MRRSFFLFLITALVVFGVYRYWKITRDRPGIRGQPERYTPAGAPKVDLKDMQVLSALDAEYTRLIEAVVPSVVSIDTSGTVLVPRPQIMDPRDLFFPNRRPRTAVEQQRTSMGSGVIVSREGHILTNHHVIAGMDKIVVQLTDGRREPAQLIGSDELTDIAVLKIDAGDLEPLPFGNSDDVRVGQMVFAIGNPFGLQETVTQGIISAKGRRAMRDSGVEFLQTDVAVNKGNSGGPLINLRGEIVGINSAIYSNSNSDEGGWLGISFAIPANTARRTLESLLKTGRVVRGYLGVMLSSVTRENARVLGLRDMGGVLIGDVVAGSPAEAAGLKPGDVVRTYNGRPVADPVALLGRLADTDIGAEVQLGIVRAGKPLTLRARIGEAPAGAALPQRAPQRQRVP